MQARAAQALVYNPRCARTSHLVSGDEAARHVLSLVILTCNSCTNTPLMKCSMMTFLFHLVYSWYLPFASVTSSCPKYIWLLLLLTAVFTCLVLDMSSGPDIYLVANSEKDMEAWIDKIVSHPLAVLASGKGVSIWQLK